MLPITPTSDTDWITNSQRRRIVTPGDNEINQDSNSNSNSNSNNRFSSLADTDSDDDISIFSTASVFAIETDAAYPADQGATDHLIGGVEQAVQIQRIRQALGGDPITATDNSTVQIQRIRQVLGDTSTASTAYRLDTAEAYLNAPFEASATAEFNRLYQANSDSDSDTAS